GGVAGAIANIECVQCCCCCWGDGIEDAEQGMTVAMLVATNQLRVIEVVTGVHTYTFWQAPPHRNLTMRIEQRYLDAIDVGGMPLDETEAHFHRHIKVTRAPVASEGGIKHVAEPM